MKKEKSFLFDNFKQCVDFHGHVCPGLAIGYQAAKAGIAWLSEHRARDEEVVAIVETDACGVDAVQVLTGCTPGKGNFIHKDHGKQVFTFISRKSGNGVRIAMKPGVIELGKRHRELMGKVMDGSATEEELEEFWVIHRKKSQELLERPAEELFSIKAVDIALPPKARIESSIPCDCCGEPTMASKLADQEGQKVCKECLVNSFIHRKERTMKKIIRGRLSLLLTIGFILAGGLLLTIASCRRDSGEVASYTIADATGDWGYPSPYAHYPRGPGYVLMSFIFETLVWKDAADFVPQLARAWEYRADENAYVFKLRKDVQWHDGTALTAEDVVFTFQYTKEHPYPWVDNTVVKSAEAVDSHTVKLSLSRPYAPFLHDVVGTQPIMPKHIWEGIDKPDQFLGPEATIGTGPYTLADYSKEHGTYLYKAVTGYYGGKPAVGEIRFVKMNAEMIPAALKGGSVNAGFVPPEIVPDMQKAGLTVITAPVSWNAKMSINHTKAPLSSKQFRYALAYAIDLDALVEITQRGHAVAGNPGMVPPTSDWYNPKVPQYRYDPAKTEQLLEGLGYTREGTYFAKDGQELRLGLIATGQFKEVGLFIKKQLEESGIRIDFKTLEAKTVDAKVAAWDFDLSIYGHGGLYEPSFLNKAITGQGFFSARYDADERLNQLLQSQLTEMDPAKRKELVAEIQEIYAEELPALTLYYPKWYWGHDGTVDLYFTKDGVAVGVPIPLNRMAFVK